MAQLMQDSLSLTDQICQQILAEKNEKRAKKGLTVPGSAYTRRKPIGEVKR